VLENRFIRRINLFGLNRDEVTGYWRKWHNEEFHRITLHQILLG
jgi:hypothetical protein